MNDKTRIHRIREIFDAAAALEGTARSDYLARACDDDDALRREVDALLAADAYTSDPLQSALSPVLNPAVTGGTGSDYGTGQRLGAYEIVDRIGQGGMGTVYVGRRSDGAFDLRVAIKVVRTGLDPEKLADRFRAERRILARLEHPHIARILDGGETDDGAPFIVMEHIDGQPIDRYCDARRATLRERLMLFRSVCDAVDYAHRQLVVHRDIKPTNVFVSADGVVKLLDFGIGKLLETDRTDVTLTAAGERPLTPAYASPEQIRGEPAGTATDVYSLGVLLYELLTGQRPFDGPTARDIERAVLETDPRLPSTAATHSDETMNTEDLAARRKTDPRGLRRALEGDLDNVVQKAIEKSIERRYPTARELADDIAHYLDGRPVTARAPTFSYRARKFITRHVLAIGVASVFVAMLVTATIVSTTAFLRADKARHEAETQRATVVEINRFMSEMFAAASPIQSQSKEDVTARDLLAAAAERIDSELGDRPEIAAIIQTEVARRYYDLGQVASAIELHRAAVGKFRDARTLNTPEGVTGLVYLGIALNEDGQSQNAVDTLRTAVELGAQLDESHADIHIEAQKALGTALLYGGDYRGVETVLLPLNESLVGEVFKRERGDVQNDLGLAYQHLGEYENAERFMRAATQAAREVLGDDHSDVAKRLVNLAFILNRMGRAEEALESCRVALQIHESIYEADHHQLAMTRINLADALQNLGQIDEAQEHYEEVLRVFRATYGDDHPRTASVLNNMARGLMEHERYTQAIAGFERAAAIYAQNFGTEHQYTAIANHNANRAYFRSGQIAEAERRSRTNLERRRRALGADHPDVARSQVLLAQILRRLDTTDEVEPLLRSAVIISAAKLGDVHPVSTSARLELGRHLIDVGQYAGADSVLRHSKKVHTAAAKPDESALQEVQAELDRLQRARNPGQGTE